MDWKKVHCTNTDWDETAYKIGKLSSTDPWFIKAFEENFFDDVLPNVKIINFIGGELSSK